MAKVSYFFYCIILKVHLNLPPANLEMVMSAINLKSPLFSYIIELRERGGIEFSRTGCYISFLSKWVGSLFLDEGIS